MIENEGDRFNHSNNNSKQLVSAAPIGPECGIHIFHIRKAYAKENV
jgi:hypothetical protein